VRIVLRTNVWGKDEEDEEKGLMATSSLIMRGRPHHCTKLTGHLYCDRSDLRLRQFNPTRLNDSTAPFVLYEIARTRGNNER